MPELAAEGGQILAFDWPENILRPIRSKCPGTQSACIQLNSVFRHDILEDNGRPSWFQEYQIFLGGGGTGFREASEKNMFIASRIPLL